MKTLLLICFCALFFSNCNLVLLEKPVPQSGTELNTFPASWSGAFEMQEDGKEAGNSLFREYLRMERLSDTRLLVSGETRIAKKDLPALKQHFLEEQKAGRVIDFQVTERFIFNTVNTEDPENQLHPERQLTRIVGEGDWYVLVNSITLLMQIDLETKTMTNYDVGKGNARQNMVLPEADSVATTVFPLVFRRKGETYFLNFKTEGQTKWSLYAVSEPQKGHLTLKATFLKDKNSFEERLDFFNQITAFKKEGSDYIIDPTDKALDQLLADRELFQTWHLKKIGMQ